MRNKYIYDKEQIIQWYKEGYNTVYITQNLLKYPKHCYKTVAKIIKNSGIKLNGRRKNLTDKDIENICELYKSGKSQLEICEMYKDKNICEGTIHYYLEKENINRRSVGQRSKVKVHDYFENIDTEEKAYFLGLMMADGSVCHNKKTDKYNIINLGLKQEDEYIIEKFKSEIGFNGKLYKENMNDIRYIKRKRWAKDGFTTIKLTSDKMANDLKKYGIVNNKSNKESIPFELIPEDLLNHFIRGLFDGDGSVYKSNNYLHVSYYGSHLICTQLLDFFKLKNKVYDKSSISFISFQKKENVKKFYDYIYKDATIYLKRKKEKFDKNI